MPPHIRPECTSESESVTEETTHKDTLVDKQSTTKGITITTSNRRRSHITLAILFAVNLLNYADRYTVAGVLPLIIGFYGADHVEVSLFQTAFSFSYMIYAPLFGYFGDRFKRKPIMLIGIAIWVSAAAATTFVPAPEGHSKQFLWLFILFRSIIGTGEAAFSTVAPTIIADMFTHDQRSRALMLFYFAIPIGTGMGFIVSSKVASISSWQWGMRTTPIVGVILCLIMTFVLQEPTREANADATPKSRYIDDVKAILKVKTFVLSTLGYTCIVFVTAGMAFWTPHTMGYAYSIENPEDNHNAKSNITMIFGLIAILTGFFGVIIGGFWAQIWRRTNARADPLVCAISAFAGVPFIFCALTTLETSMVAGYIFIFFGMLFLCFNWSIISDMLMYTIIPSRRATAMSLQIFISFAFGDVISAIVIGAISHAIRDGDTSNVAHFRSLQYALYLPNFILLIAGLFFLSCCWFVKADHAAALEQIKASENRASIESDEGCLCAHDMQNGTAMAMAKI